MISWCADMVTADSEVAHTLRKLAIQQINKKNMKGHNESCRDYMIFFWLCNRRERRTLISPVDMPMFCLLVHIKSK